MPRAHARQTTRRNVCPVGRHVRLPVGVVFIFHQQADGAAQRLLVADARQDLHFVRLDLLARAPAVPALAQGEIVIYLLRIDVQVRRQAFDDGRERPAV